MPPSDGKYRALAAAGFTLLEVLLVLMLLSSLAWMALGVVGNSGEQARFDDTRNRLALLRGAIVGDTGRTVNGRPEIRGYVADMGNLPPNIQALLSRDYCEGRAAADNPADCVAAGGTWRTQPAYGRDPVTGLWRGWRGAYLPSETMTFWRPGAALLSSMPRFRDGWGNGGGNDDDNNFGWLYPIVPGGNLEVRSVGQDGAVGGGDFDADYPPVGAPPLVAENEHRQEIQRIEVVFDLSGAGHCFRCQNPHASEADCNLQGGTWNRVGQCSDPAYTNEPACLGGGGLWNIVEQYCSYATQAVCEDPAHGGVWRAVTTHVCSNPAYLDQVGCEAVGETWTPYTKEVCRFESKAACQTTDGGTWLADPRTTPGGCKVADSTPIWEVEEAIGAVCLSVAYKDNGQIVFRAVPSVAGSAPDLKTILRDGGGNPLAFDFGSVPLPLGQAAYAITKAVGGACPTNMGEVLDANTYPAGAPLWTVFDHLPGTQIVFERKITQ